MLFLAKKKGARGKKKKKGKISATYINILASRSQGKKRE